MDFNKWVYGDLVHNSKKEPTWIMPFQETTKFIPVARETVGQYTGLKDKNGKEIYEGDIFHLGDINIKYIVEWIDTGFMGRQNGNTSSVGLEYWQDKIEVVGNIYENKELLEVK